MTVERSRDPDSDDTQTEAAYRRFDIELGTAAIVAVLFLLLRLLAVARWDWHTVAQIADTFDFSDSFAIAFGTIAAQPWITGAFTAVLLPLVLLRLFWPLPEQRGRIEISTILSAVVLAVIAFTMTVTYRSPWTLVGAVAFGAVLAAIRRFARSGELRRFALAATGRIALIAGIGILVLAVVDDEPWMGEEHITTTTRGTFDGYVLEESPGFLHILTADRAVLVLPSSTVTRRELID